MSQSTPLQDVMLWNQATCRKEVNVVLPSLIKDFSCAEDVEHQVDILRVMSSSFLPVIDISQLQSKLFAGTLPIVAHLFDKCLENVQTYLKDSNKIVDEACLAPQVKIMMQIIESMILYVVHASSSGVRLEYIVSLPHTAVYIIKQSFEHCKMSNSLYGDLFQCMSDRLMELFKKAHQLQKALITLMDLLPITSETSAECIEKLSQVCNSFHDICCIISKMDSALMVATWKFLVKLITKHKEPLKPVLDVSAFVSSLCTHIQEGFETCLEQAPKPPIDESTESSGNEKAFQRSLKICHLSAKMLVHLIKEYDQLALLKPKTLYQMLLMFYSKSPPSLYAPDLTKESQDALKNSLLICTEPILHLVCSERHFIEQVLLLNNDTRTDNEFAQCMLLACVMRHIPLCDEATQNLWLVPVQASHDEPKGTILELVFASISVCFPELALPVFITPGLNECEDCVDFHQFLVVHISSYIASIRAKDFHIVENTLLKWCLSIHTHVALVAMDVWCFLARYGTADLCNQQVRCLVEVLNKIPLVYSSLPQTHLCMLVGRLAGFMSEKHQAQLITDFPPSKCSSMWRWLPLSGFTNVIKQTVIDDIVSNCNKAITQWLVSTEPQTHADIYKLSCHIAELRYVYEHSQKPSTTLHSSIVQNVEQLWFSMDIECIQDNVIFISLIHLSSFLLNKFKNTTIIKIFDEMEHALSAGAHSDTRLAIVALLSRMGKLTFSSEIKEENALVDDVIGKISKMFSHLLADSCYIVRHEAFVVFSVFAEETAYESIVTDSLSDDVTQASVVRFLQQIPSDTMDRKTEVENLILQKDLIIKHRKTNNSDLMKHQLPETSNIVEALSVTEDEGCELSAKKSKVDFDFVRLKSILTKLKVCVDEVEIVKQETGSLPDWFKNDAETIAKKLTDTCI